MDGGKRLLGALITIPEVALDTGPGDVGVPIMSDILVTALQTVQTQAEESEVDRGGGIPTGTGSLGTMEGNCGCSALVQLCVYIMKQGEEGAT